MDRRETPRPKDRPRQLAEFLRARRERLRPADIGLDAVDRRRVPGLRREEVALRAGLSSDYYMRLEQGRDHLPSEQVLENLARALQLDEDATAHLIALGRPAPSRARSRVPTETVSPWLKDLLDTWTTTPAFVHNRRLDVLEANSLARALTPVAQPGTNMLRSFFLDLGQRYRYYDVELVLAAAVGYFRAQVGSDLDRPDIRELIDELSAESQEFREVWAKHDVLLNLAGEDPYVHPVAGLLRLRYQTFSVDGSDQQTLYVVNAAPGSQDAEALAGLRTPSSS